MAYGAVTFQVLKTLELRGLTTKGPAKARASRKYALATADLAFECALASSMGTAAVALHGVVAIVYLGNILGTPKQGQRRGLEAGKAAGKTPG